MRALAAFLAFAPVTALAQVADPAASGNTTQQFAGLLPLLAIGVVMYVMLIRPQSKRMKEHQALVAAVKKGDEIVTGGGVMGKVTAVNDVDNYVTVEIAPGVQVKVVKTTISSVVDKTAGKPASAPSKKNSAVKNDNVVPSKDQIANDN